MINFRKFLKENNDEWYGTDTHDFKHKSSPISDKKSTESHPLNWDEEDSLHSYIGSTHHDINHYHRTGNIDFPEVGNYHSRVNKVKTHTNNLDSAISKSKTKVNLHVWRGSGSAIGLKDLNPRDTFHDKGFVSTSLNPSMASNFADVNDREKHLFHIKVPKGSNALEVDHHINTEDTMNGSEDEVLLPRNSKFRYEGKETHVGKSPIRSEKPFTTHIHHLTYLGQHEDI